MNCKQGDLAVVVRSHAGNEGYIVTCVRLSACTFLVGPDGTKHIGPIWETDRDLLTWDGKRHNLVRDAVLRPIRDNDGEDETLSWAGKPQPVREVA